MIENLFFLCLKLFSHYNVGKEVIKKAEKMKKIVVLLTVLFVAMSAFGATSLIRVDYSDILKVTGFDIVRANQRHGVEICADSRDITILDNLGIAFTVLIPDMESFYRKRLEGESKEGATMGGYRTYSEISAKLDSLHARYPHIIGEKFSIGTTYEGRDIWCVKMSDNPETDEDEPKAHLDGAIHAREVICAEILLYYMEDMCINYGSDNLATYIVNERETYIIPVLNPDGYVYNEITDPAGGGMWRKNRFPNRDGSFGVDLNRNYDYMWGIDDYGSSPVPSDMTYRGTRGFSELETQAHRDFINANNFNLYLNYHSYSGMYLTPWGYTATPTEDAAIFNEMGAYLSRYNGYAYGPASTVIYLTNGGTFDWTYGEVVSKPKLLGSSPEVGGSDDGFWPPPARKPVLIAQEQRTCRYISLAAGAYPVLSGFSISDALYGDGTGYPDPGEEVELSITLRNIGLMDCYNVSVTAYALDRVDEVISSHSGTAHIASFTSELLSPSLLVRIGHDVEPEDSAYIVIRIETADRFSADETLAVCVGTPRILVNDDFELRPSFIATGDWEWGTPTSGPMSAKSGRSLWATRLSSRYTDNITSTLTTYPVSIPSDLDNPRLSFWHWYSTESDGVDFYDGGNVKLSADGSIWAVITPMNGYDGNLISYNPMGGEPAFSGKSDGWEHIVFDVSAYRGASIRLRFDFGADPYVGDAGWFIDDLLLYGWYPAMISEDKSGLPLDWTIITASPNPFNSSVSFGIKGLGFSSLSATRLIITDIKGNIIETLAEGDFNWTPKDDVPSGIYLVRPKGRSYSVLAKVFYVR